MKRWAIAPLAVAIIAGFLAVGACQLAGSTADCEKLVGVSVGSRLGEQRLYLVVISGSNSTCRIRTPSIKLVSRSGAVSDFHQDRFPATEGLQVGPHQAAAIPFWITPGECSQVIRFDSLTAEFGGGVNARVETATESCPGGRIEVWLPISVQRCMDGTIIWPWPTTDGSEPAC